MVDVSTWSETPGSNTTVDGISIAEGCSPANVNNGMRSIMAGVKTFHVAYSAHVTVAVTLTGTQTLANKTLTSPAITTPTIATPTYTGTPIEDVYTITDGTAFEIDPANGSVQIIVLGANRTPKATNMANGQSVTLMVDDGSAYTLTWSDTTFGGTGVKWAGGAAPSLAATGYTWIGLTKVGGQVYGWNMGATG
jgi:hypothetical protein